MRRRPIIGLSLTVIVLLAIIGIASLPDEVLVESSTIENSQIPPDAIQSVPTIEEVSDFVSESISENEVKKTNAELSALKKELDQLKKELSQVKISSDIPENMLESSETPNEELEDQSKSRVILINLKDGVGGSEK
jgi:septal ring factor EnvC (AmiA/AmiB activator)